MLKEFAAAHGRRVQVVSKAVGGAAGRARFDASDPLGGLLLEADAGGGSIEVEVTTIDAAVAEFRLKQPFLLKLDTHGVEAAILSGAVDTLHRPLDGSLWQMDLMFVREDWPGFRVLRYR